MRAFCGNVLQRAKYNESPTPTATTTKRQCQHLPMTYAINAIKSKPLITLIQCDSDEDFFIAAASASASAVVTCDDDDDDNCSTSPSLLM